nr:hypothetical protein [Clostridioides difficile]
MIPPTVSPKPLKSVIPRRISGPTDTVETCFTRMGARVLGL